MVPQRIQRCPPLEGFEVIAHSSFSPPADGGRSRWSPHPGLVPDADEYDALLATIRRDYPEQAPAFVVSIFTGMRWSEQFQMKWSQVDFKRKVVHISETKDPKGRVITRNVPVNSVAFTAIQEQEQRVVHKPTDLVFPDAEWYCRFWFIPAMKSAGVDDYT